MNNSLFPLSVNYVPLPVLEGEIVTDQFRFLNSVACALISQIVGQP